MRAPHHSATPCSRARARRYQPDENLALGVVVDEASGFRLSVMPVVSEDVGEPFSVFTYLPQTFAKPPPIAVPEARGTPKETHAACVATLKAHQANLVELNRPMTEVRALGPRAPRPRLTPSARRTTARPPRAPARWPS